MKSKLVQIGLMALAAGVLTACGGGGGGSAALPTPQPVGNVAVAVAAAGFTGGVSNATPTVNPKMVFQLAGATPVTISTSGASLGRPVVNFTVVDSSGKFVPGLKLLGSSTCGGSNMSFAIAKYDGVNWQSLISRQRYATTDMTNRGTATVPLYRYAVVEGTTDPKPTATVTSYPAVGALVENTSDNYYTYSFSTDVTNALLMSAAVADANGVSGKVANNGQLAAKDGQTIHRLAVQLCYVDPVTQVTVKVNPYVDFTLAANGVGVPVKDVQGAFTDAKKVADRASCNECHNDFAQHGGGRVDPNFCVVCHNAGSTDYNTNNSIDFKLMVHKLHMGKRLTQPYQVVKVVANDVIYPQNVNNCVVCHDGSATAKHKTAQGDNWRFTASKNACFSCHDDYKSGNWQTLHTFNRTINGLYPSNPDASIDSVCASCHNDAAVGGVFSDGTVHVVNTSAAHAVQQWTLSENYQYNILSVTLNPAPVGGKRSVTIRYSISNPKTGTDYDLQATGTSFDISSAKLLLSWNTTDYDSTPITLLSGSGTKVGSTLQFEVSSDLPDAASGTGVVAFQGRIKVNGVSVPVKNVVSYFAITDATAKARRVVVSADKCNSCHGKFLGYSNTTTAAPGFGAHGSNRNDPQVCVICHNGNLTLADGSPGHFKALIHKLHEEQGANYPVWPLATSKSTGAMNGLYTGIKVCVMCHEGDSWKSDKGVQGSTDLTAAISAITGGVISPKASACYSCHTSASAKDHMISVGGAQFGTVTQANLDLRLESCDSCHSTSSSIAPVDKVHGQ